MSGRALLAVSAVPAAGGEAASRRSLHAVHALTTDEWRVTMVCEDAAPPDLPLMRDFAALGVEVYAGPECAGFGDEYLPDRTALLSEARFRLAILEAGRLGRVYLPLLRRASPETRVLVDVADLGQPADARERAGAAWAYAMADGVLVASEPARQAVELACAPSGGVHLVASDAEPAPSDAPRPGGDPFRDAIARVL